MRDPSVTGPRATMPDTSRDASAQATASDAQVVVEAFIHALEQLDIDRAMTLAHSEIVYQNVPFPPARGIRATERTLRAMLRFGTGFQARMLNIAAQNDVVLTERIDVLEAGRFRMHFWVCGTFELQDGKVVLWRDRFDFLDTTIGFIRALVGIAIPALNRR
jgi:limonene-1,2-epoxide hydrolase